MSQQRKAEGILKRSRAALLRSAASCTMRTLRDHRKKASELQELFLCLEARLFDPALTVWQLALACGLREREVGVLFKANFGQDLRSYITTHRVEVAAKLLQGSPLKIREIGHLVGFLRPATFTETFREVHGINPRAYRARMGPIQLDGARAGELPVPLLRKALKANATAEEAEDLKRLLKELYSIDDASQQEHVIADGWVGSVVAGGLWGRAMHLPPTSLQRLLNERLGLTSFSLFEELLERSREVGRRDRQHGIEVAELALDVLRECETTRGEPSPDREALGWARVGNAHRLALEIGEAESAFSHARDALGRLRVSAPLLEAEVWHLEAALRLVQRRFTEALELEKRAIAVFRSCGAERAQLVRGWLQQANILAYSGHPKEAIDDLLRALQMLEGEQEPYLLLTAYGSLAAAYAMVGEPALGSAYLPHARALCHRLGHRLAWCQLQWTEGHLRAQSGDRQSAEELFLEARETLQELGEMDSAAVVALDLAVFYSRQGHLHRSIELVGEALPIFQALQLDPDTAKAVSLLRDGWAAGEVTLARLRAALSLVSIMHGLPVHEPGASSTKFR